MTIPRKEISILGCGWYGMAMAEKLLKNGYEVKGSTTSASKLANLQSAGINPFLLDFQHDKATYDPEFFNSELLLICIPPKRSTAEQHTYLSKIEKIATAAAQGKVKQLIFISSTSVYANKNLAVNENTIASPETASGKAILSAEFLLKHTAKFNTTVIRFAGLFGPGRDPGRFFAGKTAIPNGDAPVNMIHLNDCTGITFSIIVKQAYGLIYNACAPQHPKRSDFYTAAALVSGLELPAFKNELLDWKKVESLHLTTKLGYTFEVDLNS